MALTKAKKTSSPVEAVARLFLASKPAEISEQMAQLCDWLMGEFHQLPLSR
jgi:hypothetical protein